MAAMTRLLLLLWFFLSRSWTLTLASPIIITPSHSHLLLRAQPIINNATGVIEVFNPSTGQLISQGPASDGSGSGFSPPAVIWLVFAFLVGIPMAFAGIRGWRLTTGVGIGLATSVCSWAAFVNTVSSVGVSDTLLTAIVLAFFVAGFILGLFEFGRLGGIALLGISGGLSFGIRIMIIKDGLLIATTNLFAVNWLIIATLGAAGGLCMIWWQRVGIVFSSASVGTFLSFLGVDLVTNKQAGMSRGLRYLFDRNSSHLADIITNGYNPPISTKIILVVSLVLTPVLAYAQHRIFRQPFSRKPPPPADLSALNLDIDVENTDVENPEVRKRKTVTSIAIVSGIWGGAMLKSASRFSL